jgi:hypothetical protein
MRVRSNDGQIFDDKIMISEVDVTIPFPIAVKMPKSCPIFAQLKSEIEAIRIFGQPIFEV